jgi:hypothetical protein
MNKYRSVLILILLLMFILGYGKISSALSGEQFKIVLNPEIKYQTISGWEATSQSGQLVCAGFDQYKNELFDEAVNDLGINRLRLEIKSGIENPVDYFTQYVNGQITRDEWKANWYTIINDNSEHDILNANGFQFNELDYEIDRVVQPMRERLQANGETLFVNLNYVDFGSSAFEHKTNPEEYAEFVLATYQHIQAKYGWVPDAWEVILEPDTNASWSAPQIGNAIAATAVKLQAHEFTPNFIAPSTTNMSNSVSMFDQLIQIPGVLPYISELAYHRYTGVSDASLQAIASRAVQYGINSSMLEHIGSGYQDLHNDLKMGRTSAWQQFTLGFCTNDNGAQYYWIDVSNPNNPSVNMGSRTKFLRQYFKYIRTGAVRIEAVSDSNDFDPLAFINPNGSFVIVVKAETGGALNILGLPEGNYKINYTTDHQYNIDLPNVSLKAGQELETAIPEKGVITIYTLTDSLQNDSSFSIPAIENQTPVEANDGKACSIHMLHSCRKK